MRYIYKKYRVNEKYFIILFLNKEKKKVIIIIENFLIALD